MAEHLTLHNVFKGSVFMCGAFKASHFDYMAEKKINAMLFLNSENKDKNTIDEYTDRKIQHYFVETPEDPKDCDFEKIFKQCTKIIRHFEINGGKIAVYCQNGVTYSAAVIAAYLLHNFYVEECKRSPTGKSIVIYILESMRSNNSEIDMDSMGPQIMALAKYEIKKIRERELIEKTRNKVVEYNIEE